MKDKKRFLLDGVFSVLTFAATFVLNLLLEDWFDTRTMIPMIFVLEVFLISWRTQGYFWGITFSLVSVLAVNYAFTYPYYAFDLISPECLSSAIVMLIVSILTGMLTTQIKHQEKLRAEAERERMRGNLLRAVSHDLRTPLTSIYGATSAILENYDSLTPGQHMQLLKDVQQDSQWLIRMVENLLSVTKVDGDRVRLAKAPTVLEELIDIVLVKFRKHYPEQAVQVSIPEDFISIPMDAMLIEQVLLNLLENAVDHAKGMTRLELEVTCSHNRARFCVRDDGCGIDPARLDWIFTGYPGSSDIPSDSGRHNMGIGLSACAAIIKAHGSEITAANLPGGGAEFTFSLNMEAANEYEPI